MSIGNSYNTSTITVGHARKVWRSTSNVYPGGGVVENINDWKDKGVIPSGRPCKFDPKEKKVKVYTSEQVKAAAEGGVAALGINGYIQEDIRVVDDKTIGTATVVYAGEIYEYMFSDEEATILKANTATPQIVWVY